MASFGLQDAQAVIEASASTARHTSILNHHLIGSGWIRLVDIELENNESTLAPERIRQAKRLYRERGFCSTDRPISLLSNNQACTVSLRSSFTSDHPGLEDATKIGPGQTTLLDGNVRITAARELLLERGSIDGRTEFQIYFAALVYDHAPRTDPALARQLARVGFLVPRPLSSVSTPADCFRALVLHRDEFQRLDGSKAREDEVLFVLKEFRAALAAEERWTAMKSLIYS